MYLTGVLFFLLHLQIFGFNINVNHFIVYVDPQKGDNYFGYSVLLYPGDGKTLGKWIKIGAPKGRDWRMNQFKDPGAVYDCPLLMETCQPIDFKRGFFTESEILNGSWIGGSMDISYKFQRMAICAYRTIFEQGTDHNMVGSCYLADLNSTFKEVIPLKGQQNRVLKIGSGNVYHYGQGQAGFSAHFPNDENAVLLGAPGVLNWAGTIIKVANEEYIDPVASRLSNIRRKRSISQKEYIADALHSKINYAFDLFGYAVHSGYFYNNKKLYYVASTPKDSTYKGKVVIFDFNGQNPVKEKTSVVGQQFGEYFGASIAVGDLNSDGYDDLIVGAPYHAEKTYNEGAVYTFLGRKQGQLREHHTLKGQQTNGQFGSAIMFLGDINTDSYGDLAIGAPYEEEFSGVLYIYKGNKEGIDLQPCQRIVGKHISPGIQGFGISISRPADIDENGYKDLVVGAYKSGNAVLLRTSPLVVVGYEMKAIPNELKQDSTEFVLNVCYWYSKFSEDHVELSRTITVDELLGRAYLKVAKEKTKNLNITIGQTTCENVTVSLRKTKDYVAPITASLSYKLVDRQKKKEVVYISDKNISGTDSFCVRCAVLDEYRSSRASYIEVPFSLGCGLDNICQSKLIIEAVFPDLRETDTFVVGSRDYLNLHTTITNKGENAYTTQLEVKLPDTLTFRQIPSECYEQQISIIICNVHNPLKTNEEKMLALSLDMKKVNKDNYKTSILIALKVLTGSNNTYPDEKFVIMKLKREADIMITGKSGQQSFLFGNETHGMPNFTQIYQVKKTGDSPLEKVQVRISIPHSIRTSSKEDVAFIKVFPPEGTFVGQPVVCTSSFEYIVESKNAEVSEKLESDGTSLRKKRQVEVFKENGKEKKQDIVIEGEEYDIVPNRTYFLNCTTKNVVCSDIVCTIGPFETEQILAVIQIKMMFDPSAVSSLVGEKDMVLYTTRGTATIEIPEKFVQNGDRPDSVEVSTLFINEIAKKKSIALWIIILAVIVGILLLVLIIYGLTKAGFFKRAKKEELKNLKAATQDMIASESTPETLDPVITCSTEGLVDEEDQIEVK